MHPYLFYSCLKLSCLKKCSKFYWCTISGFNFIKTVYEVFDSTSYLCKSSSFICIYSYFCWVFFWTLLHNEDHLTVMSQNRFPISLFNELDLNLPSLGILHNILSGWWVIGWERPFACLLILFPPIQCYFYWIQKILHSLNKVQSNRPYMSEVV